MVRLSAIVFNYRDFLAEENLLLVFEVVESLELTLHGVHLHAVVTGSLDNRDSADSVLVNRWNVFSCFAAVTDWHSCFEEANVTAVVVGAICLVLV